jgi:soluble P-type ATPase
LQNIIGHAGVTIRDIAETNSVSDKGERLALLEERKSGKVSRERMREKVRELSAPKPRNEKTVAVGNKEKDVKTHISIKAFPSLSKIVIYQVKGGNAKQLKALERDLRSYFSTNKEKYRIEKTSVEKKQP